jgi:hypothetical protein
MLARDAGGLAQAGAERLEGTLRLMSGSQMPTAADITTCRGLIERHVTQSCAAHAALNRGNAAAAAAAESLRDILLREPDATTTAVGLRRAALVRYKSSIKPDSLRKREQPIMEAIAQSVYDELGQRENKELMNTTLDVLNLLKPFAELAASTVSYAADLFSKRAALQDDTLIDQGIAYAIWAVAQLGVMPVYGLQRIELMGQDDMAHTMLTYTLHALITVPFTREPDDMNQLATAIRIGEEPEQFYNRLLATPIMRPVVQRFLEWLASHDPKVCLFDSNDVVVGYCSPHYYVSVCEFFIDAADDWASGELQNEMNLGAQSMLQAAQLRAQSVAQRLRPPSP